MRVYACAIAIVYFSLPVSGAGFDYYCAESIDALLAKVSDLPVPGRYNIYECRSSTYKYCQYTNDSIRKQNCGTAVRVDYQKALKRYRKLDPVIKAQTQTLPLSKQNRLILLLEYMKIDQVVLGEQIHVPQVSREGDRNILKLPSPHSTNPNPMVSLLTYMNDNFANASRPGSATSLGELFSSPMTLVSQNSGKLRAMTPPQTTSLPQTKARTALATELGPDFDLSILARRHSSMPVRDSIQISSSLEEVATRSFSKSMKKARVASKMEWEKTGDPNDPEFYYCGYNLGAVVWIGSTVGAPEALDVHRCQFSGDDRPMYCQYGDSSRLKANNCDKEPLIDFSKGQQILARQSAELKSSVKKLPYFKRNQFILWLQHQNIEKVEIRPGVAPQGHAQGDTLRLPSGSTAVADYLRLQRTVYLRRVHATSKRQSDGSLSGSESSN